MFIKIIIEIIVAIALLVIGSSFWSIIKSPKFMRRMLADYGTLKTAITNIGKDSIIEQAKNVQPKVGFPVNITLLLHSGVAALDKARNILLFVLIVLIAGSFFLGGIYIIINICIVAALSFFPISGPAQNNVFSDLLGVTLNIYKWNSINSKECSDFCNYETPYLKNLYKVINEL